MSWGGGTPEECKRYIESLPVPEKLQSTLPLLMKRLSAKVVQAALESMKGKVWNLLVLKITGFKRLLLQNYRFGRLIVVKRTGFSD